ncbi:CDP-glycerol glycerophosphotransferase family protein [Mumia sp. zg.B17]|uniref:CDP-glycerol glycerophosphotransferase family protein n=1 Tax=Mumia sp. zg.B17 TaxID=2855446 RepID=UPI001C6E1AEA|nr:CDP-glycerol glycerophosphotransferase family protein [Mumia sp. zg.B17]MBW9206486.1 CDP-glycerol glycerophosphotransferase family protein [Mumia sp. zg.B17]
MADAGLAPPEAGRVTAARAGDALTEVGNAGAIAIATAAALTGAVHAVVVAVLLAVVAALGFDAWRFVRRDDLPPTVERLLLGHDGALRGAVGAAVTVCFVAWGDSSAWVASLAALTSIGIVVLEPVLSQARQYRVTFVANVPGLTPAPKQIDLEAAATGAHLGALAFGAIAAGLGLSAWWWAAVTLAAALPDVIMGINAVARMRAGRRIEADLPAAVEAYAPQAIVYTAWPDDGTHQVTMWLPYLQRTGRRLLVVTRHNYPAELLAQHTDLPVVMRHGSRDLDDLVVPSLTTAFYVNASSGNSIFVRHHQITHVFLGHGDSDKPTSYNPTHAMYDRIFAAGEAAVRRYAAHGVAIPRDTFDVVGRPQVEGVRQVEGPVPADPTVLYAPTWRGHVDETAYHSLPIGTEIVAALLEREATVVFRPHPFSYRFETDTETIRTIHQMLREDAERTGRQHVYGHRAEREMSVFDCINAADAMVSDVSSVVVDWLFSGKPFAMTAMTENGRDFVAHYPIAAASYVIEGDASTLPQALDAMLGSDPLALERRAVREDYLGDFPAEGYSEVFVERAREIIDHPRASSLEGEAAEGETEDAGVRLTLGAVRRQLAVAARDVVTGGLALLTFVATLVGASRVLPLAGALVTLALFVVLHRRARPGNRNYPEIAGTLQLSRLLLVLALLVGWFDWHGASWAVAVSLAVIGAATAVETTIFDCWERVGLEARNLPSLRVDTREIVSRGTVGVVDVAALALAWLAGMAGLTAALVLLALVVAAATVVALVTGLRRVHRCVDAEDRLYATLEGVAPEFAVYFGSNVGAQYQLGMWMPYFERIGRPFVVVTRNLGMFRAIEGLTDAPLVHRPTIRSLQEVVVPSMRASFYVNNAPNNTHFLERRQMVHVWLNHGDSEKPACYNPVHAIYDRIFAAGQAGIDRYARHGVEIPREKFEIVGRPQVEDITPARGPVDSLEDLTVLYAPTWRGPYADSEVYSLPRGKEIVSALLERGARVIFRSHPFNYRFPDAERMITKIGALLDADRARTGRQHVWGPAAEEAMSLVDCFNASDAMVADVSAVVSDYLQSGKPFAMISVGRSPEQLRTEAPAARAAYVVDGALSNVEEALDAMLGDDPLAADRQKTRTYYLGDFPAGSYADGFLTRARRLVDAGPLDEGLR